MGVFVNTLVVQLKKPLEITEQAAQVFPCLMDPLCWPLRGEKHTENGEVCTNVRDDELSVQQSCTSLNSAWAAVYLFMLCSWILEGHKACLPKG